MSKLSRVTIAFNAAVAVIALAAAGLELAYGEPALAASCAIFAPGAVLMAACTVRDERTIARLRRRPAGDW
jgi:hypothetical protein